MQALVGCSILLNIDRDVTSRTELVMRWGGLSDVLVLM